MRNLTRPSELTCGYCLPFWLVGAGFQSSAGGFSWARQSRPAIIKAKVRRNSLVFIWSLVGQWNRSSVKSISEVSLVTAPQHASAAAYRSNKAHEFRYQAA